jgi:hypothetical protein
VQMHIQLIPLPTPTQPTAGPDPPENIYHFTTGLKLRSAADSRGAAGPLRRTCP